MPCQEENIITLRIAPPPSVTTGVTACTSFGLLGKSLSDGATCSAQSFAPRRLQALPPDSLTNPAVIPRASQYSAHHPLRGSGAEPVQEFLAGLRLGYRINKLNIKGVVKLRSEERRVGKEC